VHICRGKRVGTCIRIVAFVAGPKVKERMKNFLEVGRSRKRLEKGFASVLISRREDAKPGWPLVYKPKDCTHLSPNLVTLSDWSIETRAGAK
jgi:hypothetical protein